MTEISNLNNMCRCCHNSGKYRSLTTPFFNEEVVEVYSEMLQNTLGVMMHPPPFDVSSKICDVCVENLRKAAGFKKQVLECEERFEEYYKEVVKQNITAQTELMSPNEDDDPIDTDDMWVPAVSLVERDTLQVKIEHVSPLLSNKNEKKDGNTGRIRKEEVWITEPIENGADDNKDIKKPQQTQPLLRRKTIRKPPKPSRVKKENLAKHIEIDESLIVPIPNDDTISYSCQSCGGSYHDIKKIKAHIILTHQNKFVYNCKYCDTKTYTKLDYSIHSKTHGKQYTCDYCRKRFLLKKGLRQHIYLHIRKVICDYCGKDFSDKVHLKNHIDVVHKNIYAYTCNICGEKFKANKYLKIHYRKHTGIRPYECDICKEAFISLDCLLKHIKKAHEMNIYNKNGNTEFKKECTVCGNVYENRADYIRHVRRDHARPKDLQCTICNKNFSCKYSLRRHIETHNGLKKYSCDICHQNFSQRTAVHRHKINKHKPLIMLPKEKTKRNYIMSEKAYGCDICGKKYTTRGVLNRHINDIHNSNIDRTCTFCGLKLSSLKHLKRHIKRKHNDIVKTENDFDYSFEAFTIPKDN